MNELTTITPEQLTPEIIRKHICAEATEQEMFLFLQIAKACKLNPFLNQIYLVKYGGNKAQILTSYNVYLQRAERSGAYAGLETKTYGAVETKDLRAEVKVYRKDWERPLIHEVWYDEYVQKTKEGKVNRFWGEKPRTMITKVAISQAFRLAFPLEFEGMPYTSDEVIDTEKLIETAGKPVESPRMPLPPKVNESINTNKTNATEAILDEKKPIPTPIAEEKPVFEGEPVKAITKTQGIALMELAKKNGYTQAEVKDYIKTLGYEKHTELNELDYPDVLKKFGVKK